MRMIRRSQLVGAASIGLVLCVALIACIGEDLPTRVITPTGSLTTWLGEFDGAASVLVYATDSTYGDASGNIAIERVSSEIATVLISVGVSPRPGDLEEIADFTGGLFGDSGVGWEFEAPVASVALNSNLTLTEQIGDRRRRLALTRSGDRITGLLYVDFQQGDGTYEVAGRIEFDVTRQQ